VSAPTLSRFENSVTPRFLYTMGMTLAKRVILRHGKRRNGHARLVSIDMDPTDTATYGDTRYAAKTWKRERQKRLCAACEALQETVGEGEVPTQQMVLTRLPEGIRSEWIASRRAYVSLRNSIANVNG
jgi:hypothetical protein